MNFRKQPRYLGYHHLTYACFAFVLVQVIFLVAIQTITQRNTAKIFFEEKPYILYTLKSNLDDIDYSQDSHQLLTSIQNNIYSKLKRLTTDINITPNWQLGHYQNKNKKSNYILTNYLANPYIIQINFPKQKITLYVEFRISLGAFWGSFLASIFVMIAFLLVWVIFIYAFNISFKSRIIQGFNLSREQQRSSRVPGDLTGELIHEVQGLMDEKHLMLSALSHDLKTPLTELELKLYLLEDQELASQMLKNTQDITQIVRTSLQYAKGLEHVEKDKYDISSFLHEICTQSNTPKKPVMYKTELKTCIYKIEKALFKRMIANLIVNAKKYANNCDVTLSKNIDDKVLIIIQDNGPGVPEDQLDTLGTPFFRADTSRSRKTGGTGLGLAIVKQIATIHDFIILFSNKQDGGLKITLTEI
jgi:signal transduction histidine kinase